MESSRRHWLMSKLVVWLFRTLSVAACLWLSACVVVDSAAISESAGGGTGVTTDYSDYGILHLSDPSDLTSNASAALAKQCQSGMLTGVSTQLKTREWFLLVQYYTVTASAVCK
jgi:hypothetical protein